MKYRHVLALILMLVGVVEACAQDAGAAKVAATHDEIRAMRDELLKAIQAKDADALIKHLHPDVVITSLDGKELKSIRKHEGVRDYLARMLTGPKPGIKSLVPSVNVDELTILHGDDTGIAFGSSKDHYVLADGSEFDLSTRWSATLIKHEGKWKVANLHYSTNLFDNPVLEGAKRMMYWVGGIAAGVGLLAGLLIMWVLRK